VLIIIAPSSTTGRNGPVLWVLAVLSTITVAHRIIYTYQNTSNWRRRAKDDSNGLSPPLKSVIF